jgi:hypothetical protein
VSCGPVFVDARWSLDPGASSNWKKKATSPRCTRCASRWMLSKFRLLPQALGPHSDCISLALVLTGASRLSAGDGHVSVDAHQGLDTESKHDRRGMASRRSPRLSGAPGRSRPGMTLTSFAPLLECVRRALGRTFPTRCPLRLTPQQAWRAEDSDFGGDAQNRTGDGGFADLCLATWLRRRPSVWILPSQIRRPCLAVTL